VGAGLGTAVERDYYDGNDNLLPYNSTDLKKNRVWKILRRISPVGLRIKPTMDKTNRGRFWLSLFESCPNSP
jgi:hypothetical protein